jgi:hypothetical protein
MWEPQPLATLRASTACTGITLPIFAMLPFDLYDSNNNNHRSRRFQKWTLKRREEVRGRYRK